MQIIPISPSHPDFARCVSWLRRFDKSPSTELKHYLGKDRYGKVLSPGVYRIWEQKNGEGE